MQCAFHDCMKYAAQLKARNFIIFEIWYMYILRRRIYASSLCAYPVLRTGQCIAAVLRSASMREVWGIIKKSFTFRIFTSLRVSWEYSKCIMFLNSLFICLLLQCQQFLNKKKTRILAVCTSFGRPDNESLQLDVDACA